MNIENNINLFDLYGGQTKITDFITALNDSLKLLDMHYIQDAVRKIDTLYRKSYAQYIYANDVTRMVKQLNALELQDHEQHRLCNMIIDTMNSYSLTLFSNCMEMSKKYEAIILQVIVTIMNKSKKITIGVYTPIADNDCIDFIRLLNEDTARYEHRLECELRRVKDTLSYYVSDNTNVEEIKKIYAESISNKMLTMPTQFADVDIFVVEIALIYEYIMGAELNQSRILTHMLKGNMVTFTGWQTEFHIYKDLKKN